VVQLYNFLYRIRASRVSSIRCAVVAHVLYTRSLVPQCAMFRAYGTSPVDTSTPTPTWGLQFNTISKGFINCNTNAFQSLTQLHGKSSYFQVLDDQAGPVLLEEPHLVDSTLGGAQPLSSPSRSSPHSQGSEGGERFSRKVFVGGLPPDIDEDEITASFRRFGPLVVDWPHKAESKSYFPPKGYAFLLFQVG
jgi:hypothetical protein